MKLHTKEYLEEKYATPDPWGYQTNPADIFRKERILAYAESYGPYCDAIDIGAGEGWITAELPSKHIYATEISDAAAARFPDNVLRIPVPVHLHFDLVLATGVLYEHYDWEYIVQDILGATPKTLITCHIKEAEVLPDLSPIGLEEVAMEVFPYRGKKEILRVFK